MCGPTCPPHTVLRIDIDTVDVTESSDAGVHKPAKEGFRSVNAGECHACAMTGMPPTAVRINVPASCII